MNMEENENVELEKIDNIALRELIAAKVLTNQGLRVMGNGIIIKEIVENNKQNEKILSALYHMESKIDTIREKMGIEVKKSWQH